MMRRYTLTLEVWSDTEIDPSALDLLVSAVVQFGRAEDILDTGISAASIWPPDADVISALYVQLPGRSER